MQAHEAIIFYLAQIYGVPIYTDDSGNQKVESVTVKEALLWSREKLQGKTQKELKHFKDCVQDGFLSTSNRPFPLRRDLNQAYDLCFPSIHPASQEKYISLADLRPQIEGDTGDVNPEEFELLKYLRDEAALITLRGPRAASDILFRKYGYKGMMEVGKWKGEYQYKNCIDQNKIDRINWIDVYNEILKPEEAR